MIELKNLSKSYDDLEVVSNFSLKIEPGELVALVGGSGSGKTTTLRMINRLIEPSSGEVLINGLDTSEIPAYLLRRQIGYVFQQVGLFPHMSIAQNISVPMKLAKWPRKKIQNRINKLLDLVHLEREFKDRKPEELSGGQQQRVGVARALATEPTMMLLDEPFGALDPIIRDQLQQMILELKKNLGLTGIFVTHDVSEAMFLADQIAVMESGKIIQIGSPSDLMNHPKNSYVAQIMGTPQRQALAIEEILDEDSEGSAS